MKTVKLISIALAGALFVLSACKKDSDKESKGPEGPGGETVTDACGNTYSVVKIGKQYWMAENIKCDKYATQSEAYNAPWLSNNTILTAQGTVFTPYHTDPSDKSIWNGSSREYSSSLTNEQIAKLGYHYNWAAAVGVEDGRKQTTAFSGNRQGICPNGWHVPSKAEWQTLEDYIHDTQKISYDIVGKYLKTTSGWYKGGNGLDSYGFAVLPAGYDYGEEVFYVGDGAHFWTATPHESEGNYAYYRSLICSHSALINYHENKYDSYSVRCLKD